jgi:hypothetical protein
MRYYRPWLVEWALEVLEKHSRVRYASCRNPENKRGALAGQAEGLIRHDRILNGRKL